MIDTLMNGLKKLIQTLLDLEVNADSEFQLTFQSAPPGWVLFFGILGLAAAVMWLYRLELRKSQLGKAMILAGLRFLTVILVVLILCEPVLRVDYFEDRRGLVLMLVDTSQSMSLTDTYPTAGRNAEARLASALKLPLDKRPSELERLDLVRRIFDSNPELADQFEARGEVRWFEFSSKTRADVELKELKPNGTSSDLRTALDNALEAYPNQPIAAIIVITDGQHNATSAWKPAVQRANDREIPIFAVAVGDERPPKDLWIKSINADKEAPVHSKLVFKVNIGSSELPTGTEVVVHLQRAKARQDNTTPLNKEFSKVEGGTQTHTLEADNAGQVRSILAEFLVPMEEKGAFVYRAMVQPKSDERNKTNNVLTHTVQVKDNRIKVLFVDQVPRYEYRYLRSLLVRETKLITAWTFLLDADPEYRQDHTKGKFTDSTGKEHPIRALRTLPKRSSLPVDPTTGAPSLSEFDIVILGDINPKHPRLPKNFLKELKTFVLGDADAGNAGGGSLVMIAGEWYNPALFSKTPLRDILPIHITPVNQAGWKSLTQAYRYQLTVEGKRISRITRLLDDEEQNAAFWQGDPTKPYSGLPGFYWFYPVEKIKPVASVLVRHATANTSTGEAYPLIVTSPTGGGGHSLFIALDSLWRWRRDVGDRYYHRFWAQAIQEMTGSKFLKSRRVSIELESTTVPLGQPVTISAKLLDETLLPPNGKLQIIYQVLDGEQVKVDMDPSLTEELTFSKQIQPEVIGEYRIWVEDASAVEVSERQLGRRWFRVQPSQFEKKIPNTNLELLEAVAQANAPAGGRLVRLHELAQLPEQIQDRTERVKSEPREEKPHNNEHLGVLLLIVFLGLICTEWLLRKRQKLI